MISIPSRHKVSRYLLTFLATFSIISIWMGTSSASVAYADMSCSQVSGGVRCNQFPDTGGNSIWCTQYFTNSQVYNSQMSFCMRALQITRTGDNKRYAIFNEEITQDPDTSNTAQNWTQGSADTSVNGNASTAHGRFWSINTRTDTPGFDQENFQGLEIPRNQCVSNGGSVTLSVSTGFASGGASWSETDPLFDSCMTIPSGVDVWSRYYDYTLENGIYSTSQLTTDMTFAQWESNVDQSVTHNSFWIAASVKAQFNLNNGGYSPATPISSGYYQDVYNW